MNSRDICRQCQQERGSSIHSTESSNIEIKMGAHPFKEPFKPNNEQIYELTAHVTELAIAYAKTTMKLQDQRQVAQCADVFISGYLACAQAITNPDDPNGWNEKIFKMISGIEETRP